MLAQCENCGSESHWRNTRGARLADLRCGWCGGRLRMPERRAAASAKGKRYAACAVCGRRRLHPRRPEWPWIPKWGVSDRVYLAGTPCCAIHEAIPAALAGYPGGRAFRTLWLRDGMRWEWGPGRGIASGRIGPAFEGEAGGERITVRGVG